MLWHMKAHFTDVSCIISSSREGSMAWSLAKSIETYNAWEMAVVSTRMAPFDL